MNTSQQGSSGVPAVDSLLPIGRRPLHEEVLDRLRDLIVQGSLKPGSRMNERLLCEQLGISRTPLREALKLLANEGLVRLLPNRGAIVSPIDPEQLSQALVVLGALEGLAGELVCRHGTEASIANIRALHYEMLAMHARNDRVGYFRLNQAIHLAIVEASGNSVLAHSYRQLNANVKRARYMANLFNQRWDAAVAEHEAILAALVARDAPRLKALLAEHLAHKLAGVLGAMDGEAEAA